MTGTFKKAITALALGATVAGLAASAPADAQRYRGGYSYHGGYGYRGGGYRGGWGPGAAVGLGILGFGLGVAAASPHYYGTPAYYGDYYAPPPPTYYRDCYARRVWDPYARAWVMERAC